MHYIIKLLMRDRAGQGGTRKKARDARRNNELVCVFKTKGVA
jgi:hypothetical protein